MVTADRIRAELRAGDRAGRFGGDEVAVLMGDATDVHDTDVRAAVELGERLVRSLSEPLVISGHLVGVGTSVGIAIGVPGRSRPS